MKSSVFDEWVKEEREETIVKTTKENMLEQLKEKFDFIPRNIKESIESIYDIDILKELNRKLIKAETISQFEELVNKAKKMN